MKTNITAAYIHIPFCQTICTYCDFCKMFYKKEWTIKYLNALKEEITKYYRGEYLDTIYIGGGTPSVLDVNELEELLKIVSYFNKNNNYEYTFECNVENITEEKLYLLKKYGVNRLSIGVQTFNTKYLKYLNRHHDNEEVIKKINIAKKIGFKNINIDLIYALKNETLKDLEYDLDMFLKLNINHISTYSLIIEPNTILDINNEKNISEESDYEMYKLINKKLNSNGYKRYEVSNFAKEGYESRHNLTYWNNKCYYGFGLGAAGYIDNIRYTNTRSLKNYLNGMYRIEEEILDEKKILENEFILGFRKAKGINKNEFCGKYNTKIEDNYNIMRLIEKGKLIDDGSNIYIDEKYVYTMNSILINFIGE